MKEMDHVTGSFTCRYKETGDYAIPLMAVIHSSQIFFGFPFIWICRMACSSHALLQTTHFSIGGHLLCLAASAEIITGLVFPHRPGMFRVIWLKADIHRYLLHWFAAAGGSLFLFFDDGFFLAGLTLIIINRMPSPHVSHGFVLFKTRF